MSEEPIYPLCAFMLLTACFVERRNTANYKQTGQFLSLGQSSSARRAGCVSDGLGGGSISEPLAEAARGSTTHGQTPKVGRDVEMLWWAAPPAHGASGVTASSLVQGRLSSALL